MAYSNAWNESVPLGSAARSSVDDLFRQMKLDLRERLVPLVFNDLTSDPVVLNPAILGNVTGKVLNIHWSDFSYGEGASWTMSSDGVYLQFTATGAYELYAPLKLPPGAVITKVEYAADQNAGGAMTFNVKRTLKSLGSTADVFSNVLSSGGYGVFSTGVVNHTVDAGYIYYVHVTIGNPNRLYGVAVTYNVADSRITL